MEYIAVLPSHQTRKRHDANAAFVGLVCARNEQIIKAMRIRQAEMIVVTMKTFWYCRSLSKCHCCCCCGCYYYVCWISGPSSRIDTNFMLKLVLYSKLHHFSKSTKNALETRPADGNERKRKNGSEKKK